MSQFGVTVGQSIGRHLVVATTVKLVNALDDTEADLDVGAMAAFGVMRFGVDGARRARSRRLVRE